MNVQNIIDRLPNAGASRIAVFGDYALDTYFYIDPARDEPSAETGMSAYQVHRRFLSPGVGGTIANNLRALGAQVVCIGVVGDDGQGWELLRELERIGADTSLMIREESMCTCTYIKPMRKGEDGLYRELNRVDLRNFSEPPRAVQETLLQNLTLALETADAVIVTDQFYQRNLGAVTDWLRERLSALAAERTDKIFYADSRSFADEYRGMMVKCNNLELFAKFSGGEGDPEDLDAILEKGRRTYARNGNTFFVTRGSQGIVVFDGGGATEVPAFRVEGELDIVGAGDATNAGIVLGLTLGLAPAEAALLGCCVSSITIQQIGTTGTASPEAVAARLRTL